METGSAGGVAVVPDNTIGAEAVAEQVLDMPQDGASFDCPVPLPPQLQHFKVQRFHQALQALHLQQPAMWTWCLISAWTRS